MARILDDMDYREAVKKVEQQLNRHKIRPSAVLMDFVEKQAKGGKGVRELLGLFGINVIKAGENEMNKNLIASELVAVKNLIAGKAWQLGDGWTVLDNVEDYVMYAVADMVEALDVPYRISKREFPSEIGRTIGLPSNWGKREVEKVLDDMTDINYHTERTKVERALKSAEPEVVKAKGYMLVMNGGTVEERDEQKFIRMMEKNGFRQVGVNDGPMSLRHRPEMQGAPKFKGVMGPMWGGNGKVRYETAEVYRQLSASTKVANIGRIDSLEDLAESISRKGGNIEARAKIAMRTGNFGELHRLIDGAILDFKDYRKKLDDLV